VITLYRRGKVFWADATFGGQRQRWSLKTRDRQVAEQLKRAYELDKLGHGKLNPKTWEEFKAEFLADSQTHARASTMRGYRHVLKRFSQFLETTHTRDVADLSPFLLTRYVESRRKDIHRINHRPMSEGGIKYELRVLRCAFNFAIECGYLEKNPVRAKNLNATSGRTQPFSQDEVGKMLDSEYLASKPYLRAVVLLFLHTGLRISDVIYLKKTSIANGILSVKTQKRDTTVRLILHPDVREALKEVKSPGEYVFTTDTGRPIVSLDKHLRRLWKACGIVGGHAHRFRDTFSVRLLETGASLYDVAKLLGISQQTADLHYSPYCLELQARGAALIRKLDYGR
jgi:site-specific recombinase XerD